MWLDYLFYLRGLPIEQRNQQLLTLLIIFSIMLVIGIIDELIRKNRKKG